MAKITEDYVSFETAKLLREKGCNVICRAGYTSYGILNDIEVKEYLTNVTCPDTYWECTAPTQQMAMKWLREVHGLFISIGNDDLDYNWQIFDIKNRTNLDPTCLTDSYAGHRKYEQACEAAIKYCLENLI